jgi:hypothetical protein
MANDFPLKPLDKLEIITYYIKHICIICYKGDGAL